MTFNKILFLIAVTGLVACQPKAVRQITNSGDFQCIAATITLGGKPVTSVVQWNTKTGMTRLLDSAVFTSKATGSQNTLVGWVPLGDLNVAVQELLNREQQVQQQRRVAPPVAAPTISQKAAPISSLPVKPGKSRR